MRKILHHPWKDRVMHSVAFGRVGLIIFAASVLAPSFAHAQTPTDPQREAPTSVSPGPDGAAVVVSDQSEQQPSDQSSQTSPGQTTGTSGTTAPSGAQPSDTPSDTPSPAETSSGQTGVTSPVPPVNTTPGSTTGVPKVAHTGLSTLFRDTVLDYAYFPQRESTWWILGIGGALAAAVHPADDSVNAHLATSGAANNFWKPGHIIGGPVMYIAPPVVYVYGRYILPRFDSDESMTNKWSHMGLDLVRAELVQEGLVQVIKVSVNRTRPNGQKYSFPSGHAAATFAFASVIERHLGARLAWPTLLIATYVGTSRLHDNVHFLSDVVFGAALGTAVGWTVVGRHGKTNYALMPTPVKGGMAIMVTRTPKSAN
jgi:membrane-associated phospholipid phosphatase